MTTITTKDAQKSKREITTDLPNCLMAKTYDEFSALISDEIIFKLAREQATVKFRAYIRNKLSAQVTGKGDKKDDYSVENLRYTLNDIIEEDLVGWTPSITSRKTKEEKMLEMVSKMNPTELASFMAKVNA